MFVAPFDLYEDCQRRLCSRACEAKAMPIYFTVSSNLFPCCLSCLPMQPFPQMLKLTVTLPHILRSSSLNFRNELDVEICAEMLT